MDLSPSPLGWSHLYAVTCFATFVLAFLLAAFVLWKNPKHPAGRMWAVMCLFVAGWAAWNTVSLLSSTPEGSIKYLRIGDAFALFIPVTFLHFAMHFSGRMRLRALKASYLATALLAATVGTPWFVQAGQKKFGIWFEQGGPTFVAFAALFVLLPAYGLKLLWQETRESEGTRKAQLLCLVAACGLGFGGGFMWFLPALGIDIPPLGAHFVALYCVIVMYAIVRYRFLDIQVVIRRSLVYSLLVTLLTVGYFGLVYGLERILRTTLGYHSAWVSLAAFAEFIPERHQDPEFARKLHEVLTAEAKRMQGLVQELLTFAKPKAPQLKPVDLAPLISSTITLLSSDLSKNRIQWSVECSHNGAAVHADSDQLRQVLINLIQNAADAMPKGGKLSIATQAINNHIELTVSDTGSGIPPALLPKIFDPFVTTKPDGNGLGLAVVYSILQAHHGTIHAKSDPKNREQLLQ